MENLIFEHQAAYYQALQESTQNIDSAPFIAFMSRMILDTLSISTPEVAPEVRMLSVLAGEMTRQQLKEALGLKDDEHFRKAYLLSALEAGLVEMTIPDKPAQQQTEIPADRQRPQSIGKRNLMRMGHLGNSDGTGKGAEMSKGKKSKEREKKGFPSFDSPPSNSDHFGICSSRWWLVLPIPGRGVSSPHWSVPSGNTWNHSANGRDNAQF